LSTLIRFHCSSSVFVHHRLFLLLFFLLLDELDLLFGDSDRDRERGERDREFIGLRETDRRRDRDRSFLKIGDTERFGERDRDIDR